MCVFKKHRKPSTPTLINECKLINWRPIINWVVSALNRDCGNEMFVHLWLPKTYEPMTKIVPTMMEGAANKAQAICMSDMTTSLKR